MKKIIVKEANIERINQEIKGAEGRASARCITASDIMDAVQSITAHLRIPKKSMVGITAYVDVNAQDFPSAYKYTPESTLVALEYTRSGWAITGIERDVTHRASQAVSIELTDEAKKAVLEAASRMSAFDLKYGR